ncbi:TPA: hypothetical protein N0F65_006111 [Lagenidium giganteum]|uniref:Tyrosinase copper-binding domain-containing protein n=1 Tax=Lagenidium giganteum TaxID=4803 RepID=A0AAV2Z0Q5_9STRA|nr:TPA: hypothetical protein N0F65_006111 [Lagenidium giganteum]
MVALKHLTGWLLLLSASIFANQCSVKADPARVRKSWNMYSQEEKDRYLSAVAKAMDLGHQYKFMLMHNEMRNNMHAHGNCGFLVWHRRYLLAYENMLRSLDPAFQEVTLPVWDYFRDTNINISPNAGCNSAQSCSQLLTDFGGGASEDPSVVLPPQLQMQNSGNLDGTTQGTCVSNGLAGHGCSNTEGLASGQCEQCLIRGNWNAAQLNIGTDFLRLFAKQNADYYKLAGTLEGSFHSNVHRDLHGMMYTIGSPFDPVFFAHHATVDMAYYLMNRCVYDPTGAAVPTGPDSTRFEMFSQCTSNSEPSLQFTAEMPMHMAFQDVQAHEHPATAGFFQSLPPEYNHYVNAEGIPDVSYRYELDPYMKGFLAANQVACPDYLYGGEGAPQRKRHRKHYDRPVHSREANDSSAEAWTNAALDVAQTLADCGNEVMELHPDMTYSERVDQQGILKCEVLYRANGGHFEDYTDEFRNAFNLPSDAKPYCLDIQNRLRSGELELVVSSECRVHYGEATGEDLTGDLTLAEDCNAHKKHEHGHHERHKSAHESVHVHVRIHHE